jgi:hypothetical protein
MATQREWESVIWHFLSDKLKQAYPDEIKKWIWGFEPSTPAQEKRWLNAIQKVQSQIERSAGTENSCDDDCVGASRV